MFASQRPAAPTRAGSFSRGSAQGYGATPPRSATVQPGAKTSQRGYTQPPAAPALARRPSFSSHRSSTTPTPTPPPLPSSRAPSPSGGRPAWNGNSIRSSSPMRSNSFRSSSPAPLGAGLGAAGPGIQRPATSAENMGRKSSKSWSPPQVVYPFSAAGQPDRSAPRSPFLRIAPLLEDLIPKYTLLIQRLATCYEDLAKSHPSDSSAVQQNPPYAQLFYSFIEHIIPAFELLVKSLAQLREICEDLWRAAGGLLSWLTEGRPGEPGGRSVEVERPDPEGGSHTVTMREVLRPVPASAIQRTITKLGMNARGFVECERRHNEATAHVLGSAENFLFVLGGVERGTRVVRATDSPPHTPSSEHFKTLLRTSVELSDLPKAFYSLLGPVSSDPTVSSGVFYNVLEASDTFHSYRRVESTISKSLVQATNAYQYLLQNLKATGYLPASYSAGVPDPPHLRPTTFISIELQQAARDARYREGMLAGGLGKISWSPAPSSRPSLGRRMSVGAGSSVRSMSRGR